MPDGPTVVISGFSYFAQPVVALNADGSALSVASTPGVKPSTSTASPSRFVNIGANATLNVKASTGNVFALSCTNANAATRYFQLHNTATFPADQGVPVYVFTVVAGGLTVIGEDFFSAAGANFATGIAFAVSTTPKTYTAATAGDHVTAVHYK